MKKALFILAIIFGSLYGIAVYAGFTGLVIPLSQFGEQSLPSHYSPPKGTKVNPLKSFDFDDGDWAVYVNFDPYDLAGLPSSIPKAIGLKSTDKSLMKHIQRTWRFTYTGSDMATITSAIYFVRNGKLVFDSGIDINAAIEGLQGPEYGWIEPDDKNALSNYVKTFERVYWPIVLIN